MSTIRVSELAEEFGISVDEMLGMLRSMEIAAQAHHSRLTKEQVARARVRWEREKRRRRGTIALPAAPYGPPKPRPTRGASRNVARVKARSDGGRTQPSQVLGRTDILRDLIGVEAERLGRWGLAPGMPSDIEETVFAAWEARLTSREDVHGRCIERLRQDRAWLADHRRGRS